jgi:hypothetical protein
MLASIHCRKQEFVDPGILLGIFIGWPALALVPAAVFGYFYIGGRSRVVLVTALLWLAYVPYELGMKLRILCSGECNIRVDLLLLYPVLLLLTLVSIVVIVRGRARAPRI